MGKLIDLTGNRYGRLVVLEKSRSQKTENGSVVFWKCQCDCGNITEVRAYCLRCGKTTSCGCYHKEDLGNRMRTHGARHSRLYTVWLGIRRRCGNPNDSHYKSYGERGITICDEWKNDFSAFEKWAYENGYDANAPMFQCTIDRIDNDGNYSPDNCRWASSKEQARNNRRNRKVTYNGQTLCTADWAKLTGIHRTTIQRRLDAGWSVEDALTAKILPGHHREINHTKNNTAEAELAVKSQATYLGKG